MALSPAELELLPPVAKVAVSVLCQLIDEQMFPALLGFGIGGSRARGNWSSSSDVDIYALLDVGPDADLPSHAAYVLERLPTPCLRREPTWVPQYGHTATLVYDDATILQLNFLDANTFPMNPMRARTKIVRDPTGRYGELIRLASELPDQSHDHLTSQAKYAVIRYIFGRNALSRGEELRASFYLSDMVRAACTLMRATTGSFDPALHLSHPEKRLEADLGREPTQTLRSVALNESGDSTRERLDGCLEAVLGMAEVLNLPLAGVKAILRKLG